MAIDKRAKAREKEKVEIVCKKEGITRMPRNDKTIWQTSSYPAEVHTHTQKKIFIYLSIFSFFLWGRKDTVFFPF
jgi:hypothetical protein